MSPEHKQQKVKGHFELKSFGSYHNYKGKIDFGFRKHHQLHNK